MAEDKVSENLSNMVENNTPAEDNKEKVNNEKNGNKILNLIHTIQPMLLFEYWFGIFRFRKANGDLHPANGTLKLFGILVIVIHVVLFCYFLKLPTAVNGTGKLVDMIDEVPSIVILLQFATSSVATSFVLSNTNINIITNFVGLDSMLHINTNDDFYKISRAKSFKFLIALTVYHFIVSVSDLATDDEITFSKFMVLPIYFEENLETLMFCYMILMLKIRLVVINNYLAKFINDKENHKASVFIVSERKPGTDDKFNLIGKMSGKNMKIRDLAATYDIIGETCSLVNQVFNYQIFMTLVSTFTYIVITIWSSLYYYRNNEAMSGAMITIIIWCITAILKVAVMSLSCENLLLARNETKILINKVIMDYDLPKPMRVQAKAFMDLIEAWPLRIFIYDMFSVDITLMLKYISVATTYLIVIIQVSHFA